ncbi:MAG: glycosyltransferase family 39 protein [Armatimonadota bacterium]|nr:glycosyltransferase family 39 protein [Armatimonadota bacterium]
MQPREARGLAGSAAGIWRAWGPAAACVLLAAVFRFASIGAKSLWFDEAYAFFAAARPLQDVVAFAAADDVHPPLYYVLLSVWIRLFGTGEAALRSLGAAASSLTVGATWWLGRRLGGPWVGGVAAFLAAIAPLQVLAAQEARMYPLLGFLTVVSWSALLGAAEGNRRAWPLYVAATVLALYTHYFALLTLAGQAVFVLVAAPRRRQAWLVSLLAAVVLFAPWLDEFFATLASGRGWPFFRPPVGVGMLTGLVGLFSFGGHLFGFADYFSLGTATVTRQLMVLLPFLGLLALGSAAVWRRPRTFWLLAGYLGVPVVVAFVFSLRFNVFYPRYFSFAFPAFALLVAFGMLRLSAWLPVPSRRAGLLVLVLAYLGINAWTLHEVYTNPQYARFDWRRAAALLSRQAGPDDLIVAFPSFGRIALAYYFKGSQRVEHMTPQEFYGRIQAEIRPDPALVERNLEILRSYAAQHEVMWLVTTQPLPGAAMERLRGLLKDIYDFRAVADFNGVTVFRLTRHQSSRPTL